MYSTVKVLLSCSQSRNFLTLLLDAADTHAELFVNRIARSMILCSISEEILTQRLRLKSAAKGELSCYSGSDATAMVIAVLCCSRCPKLHVHEGIPKS